MGYGGLSIPNFLPILLFQPRGRGILRGQGSRVGRQNDGFDGDRHQRQHVADGDEIKQSEQWGEGGEEEKMTMEMH